jgi:hypothetical protein
MQVSDIIKNMNLGVSKKALAGDVNSPLHALLLGLNQEVIDRLTDSVDKYNISASNRLKQSIITVDQSQAGVLTVAVSAEFYWKYVNYGVNGTLVNRGAPTWGKAPAGTPSFKEAILGWIKDRGLKARPGQTYEDMARVIMKGIREQGIAPRPFFTDVVNEDLKKFLTKSITAVFKEAIRVEIAEPWQ